MSVFAFLFENSWKIGTALEIRAYYGSAKPSIFLIRKQSHESLSLHIYLLRRRVIVEPKQPGRIKTVKKPPKGLDVA
jgi:hypothetical protein